MQTEQISASNKLRIIHYKFLHRLYYTPVKMHKHKLKDTDRCARCNAPQVDFLHLAWECPKVYIYWEQVFTALDQMTMLTLARTPWSPCSVTQNLSLNHIANTLTLP